MTAHARRLALEILALDAQGIERQIWAGHAPVLARAYIEATQLLSDARSVIDTLMGDSDLPEDDSEEMRLMRRISRTLAALDGEG